MKKFRWNTPRYALGYNSGVYTENKYWILVIRPIGGKAYVAMCNYDKTPVVGERRKYIICKMKRYLNHFGWKINNWEKES